jgi:hypothetical protein
MKLSIAKQLTAGLLLSMASVFANAGIINVTDEDFGAFKDTDTDLIWMDFGITRNTSLDDVNAALLADGIYEGWALASEAQIKKLVENVTALKVINGNDMTPWLAPHTGTNNVNTSRAYYYSDVHEEIRRFDYLLHNNTFAYNRTFGELLPANISYNTLLVKLEEQEQDSTEVPEPTSLALFGLAIAGLAFRRKSAQA